MGDELLFSYNKKCLLRFIEHINSMKFKAIKYRIYPTKEQRRWLARVFGCCRKIWNLMLADRLKNYKKTGKFVSGTPAQYKALYPYLKEVDSLALANVQLHLQKAFKNCFDKSRKTRTHFPKFKSRKRARKSYTTNNQNGTIAIQDGKFIKLPKIGRIKASIHRTAPEDWTIKSATVSQERDGSYYCSVLYAYEQETEDVSAPEANAIGLDYKSDGLYVDSNGVTCGSKKFFRKSQKKLARLQKGLAHKKGFRKNETKSNNYIKQQQKVAKCHRHVANQRKDFLHKQSTAIAKQYDLVCVEDLNMRAMSNKGFHNGKATMDNGYGMFLAMLEYKLRDRGKFLVKVDKFFPSSQLCNDCGTQHPEVKDLSIRTWTCPDCGTFHDRDINAAKNIRDEGIRAFLNG